MRVPVEEILEAVGVPLFEGSLLFRLLLLPSLPLFWVPAQTRS